MVAAMTRHLHSLRRMKRDYGWIHTLLGQSYLKVNEEIYQNKVIFTFVWHYFFIVYSVYIISLITIGITLYLFFEVSSIQ